MNVKIVNTCKQAYKPDPENTVRHILERIPDKFLAGLGEVCLYDAVKERTQRAGAQYIWRSRPSQYAVIEIHMDKTLSGIPFFSMFTFNAVFFFAFSDHIRRLKKQTTEPEVVAFRVGTVQYDWWYLGVWTPILGLFKIGNYLLWRIPALPHLIFRMFRIGDEKRQPEEHNSLKDRRE